MSKLLGRLHVASAAITGTIYAGFVNKAENAFTSQKDVTNEVKKALVEHMLHGEPDDTPGMSQQFSWDGGKTRYEIIVKRVPAQGTAVRMDGDPARGSVEGKGPVPEGDAP